MKKVITLLCSLLFLTLSAGWAEEVYYEGEGWIEPTPESQEPLDISKIPVKMSRFLAAGDQINVNVLANNFPDITLYTTFQDQSGNPITGLDVSEIVVTEDGVIQTITNFTESTGSCGGLTICLVFDVSGSMYGSPLADAKTAAINFINFTNPQNDRIGLAKFSSNYNVSVVQPVQFVGTDSNSNGIYDIIEAVNSLSASGSTALYDGTSLGIQTLTQEPQPKAVIVFSDGQNNDDTITINDVVSQANNDSVPIYGCGLGLDLPPLKDMTSATGGLYRYEPTASDLEDFYKDIAGALCSNYTIDYTTTNPFFDGSTREVNVTHDGGTTIGIGFYTVNSKPSIIRDLATINLSYGNQPPNTALNICGNVLDSDADTLGQILTATLFYRHINDASFTSANISLINQGSGTYSFCESIPAGFVQEPAVQYYLYVTDGLQEAYAPFNYNTLPYSIAIEPNFAPTIIHTPVTNCSPANQAVTITANVVDSNTGDTVFRVALFYRTQDPRQITPYNVVDMTNAGGNTYTAEIPASTVKEPGVDYFISAWDNNFSRADDGTAEMPHSFQICSNQCSCTINLVQGWNLIGYCGQVQSVGNALHSINGSYELVWSYEGGNWYLYEAQYPALSDLTDLKPCLGYWIKMNADTTLTLP